MYIFFHQGTITNTAPSVIWNFFTNLSPTLLPTYTKHTKNGFYYLVEKKNKKHLSAIKSEINNWRAIGFDVNVLDKMFTGSDISLAVFDMDSTVTSIETLDELAKYLPNHQKVEALTDEAMRGELDYKQSLIMRLQLFKNFPEKLITEFLQKPLPLPSGVEELINGLHSRNIPCLLISGGFYHFALHLQEWLKFDKIYCNNFEINNGLLTGKYLPPLIDAEGKKEHLLEYCTERNISPTNVLALGDGANDYPMLSTAGLGIAFRGKEFIKTKVNNQLNFAPMNAILDFWQ